MPPQSIGFIGFGEAGFTIGNGLRSAGLDGLFAYDIAADHKERREGVPVDSAADRGPLIRERAGTAGATLVAGPEALASACDVLISTVTSSSALDAARQHAPFLTGRHVYADLNSVSPALKREIDAVVRGSGAAFVEAAVMAPVAPYGHRVPMLLGGPSAVRFTELMAPFGMRLQVLEAAEIGAAAAVKMCRSIVVKGLEALLCECVLGATEYGADAHVFASLDETWPGIDWKTLADYTMNRLVVHGERRAAEMDEVAETLRAIGVDPMMAEATARRQRWGVLHGLKASCGPGGPATYQQVVDILKRQA